MTAAAMTLDDLDLETRMRVEAGVIKFVLALWRGGRDAAARRVIEEEDAKAAKKNTKGTTK